MKSSFRSESDSMGEVHIPHGSYWGAQTQRAVENFSVSELRISREMIASLALIKKHAAHTNAEIGIVEPRLAEAIVSAADEVLQGKWDRHFPIDVFQTGSGTSWNMNINEVIANRANELLGAPIGKRHPVHPNDHVNRSQSSNDVIPSAIQIANRRAVPRLATALQTLQTSCENQARALAKKVKLGRTHLQDAVPMTVGQEFSGFAVQIEKSLARLKNCFPDLEELPLGGTAVGTGINAPPEFGQRITRAIASECDLPFRPADNNFEGIAARDAQVALMGVLNSIAVVLMKIANDLRLLASGPRGALGELSLPSLQPGSSIMPGKVNPVIPEMVIQASAFVIGKATSVTIAGQNAPLQLNIMQPLIAYETITSINLLERTSMAFAQRCIDGIQADEERCAYWVEWSLALATPLATAIGYDAAAKLAYQAYREKRTIREVALESKVLPQEQIETLLNPQSMIK